MADPVYLHWARLWILTPDGLSPVLARVERVVLRDVRFVIDPVGLAISRNTGKRKTHAWAIGERVDWTPNPELAQLAWHPLVYRPRRGDDHFGIPEGHESWEVVPISGADYLEAGHERDGSPVARIAGLRFGPTERRRVQQYGGRR